MIADALLSRLDGVRSTGHAKWMARCPAHDDRSPSLSIREADTGTVLVRCFAGCSVHDIVAAIGIDVADLFPARNPAIHTSKPRASALAPIVATFERDLLIVHILLSDIADAKPIKDSDREAARASATRLWAALQEARHVV